jgi:hypothetical protein
LQVSNFIASSEAKHSDSVRCEALFAGAITGVVSLNVSDQKTYFSEPPAGEGDIICAAGAIIRPIVGI